MCSIDPFSTSIQRQISALVTHLMPRRKWRGAQRHGHCLLQAPHRCRGARIVLPGADSIVSPTARLPAPWAMRPISAASHAPVAWIRCSRPIRVGRGIVTSMSPISAGKVPAGGLPARLKKRVLLSFPQCKQKSHAGEIFFPRRRFPACRLLATTAQRPGWTNGGPLR